MGILGNALADELQTHILTIKANKIAEMIDNYHKDLVERTVDIPEFMKPPEQQLKNIIKWHINQMIQDNTIDFFYQKALEFQNGN